MKKLIAVLVIAASMSLFSAEKYAVLIAGDYNATGITNTTHLWNQGVGDRSEFWNDLYLQWEMLTQEKGYKPENVIVLFANGIDHSITNPEIDIRYSPTQYTGYTHITNYAASEANVQAVCADLYSKMVYGDDFLYVWVMSHSSSGSIYLMNDALTGNVAVTYSTFANYFKGLTALKKVYQLSMNYALNLKIQLQETNAVIISSCSADAQFSYSYEADQKIVVNSKGPGDYVVVENEDIGNKTYYHGEVNYHMYSAINGKRPDGENFYYYTTDTEGIPIVHDYFSDADINSDGHISILEAFTWMKEDDYITRVSTPETPAYYDTGTGGSENGRYISFKYPTLITSSEIDGWYYGPTTLKGNIGILNDVWSWFNVEPFSDVTILRKPLSSSEFWSGIDLDYDCVVKTESPEVPIDIIYGISMISTRVENMKLNFLADSQLDLVGRCTFSGVDLNFNAGSTVNMNQATLNTADNTTITGNITFPEYSELSVTIGTKLIVKSGSTLEFLPGSKIWLGQGSELVIDAGATLAFNNTPIVVSPGSRFTINGTFTGTYYEASDLGIYPETKGESWVGIVAGIESTIALTNVKIAGAECAISGSPASISLVGCKFTDCINGVNFVYCNDYTIENNTFTGMGSGIGVCLTTFNSLGTFKYNTIENFARGVLLTFSSPIMSKNIIRNNANYGLYVTGYSSYPQLINPGDTALGLNNSIVDNGLGTDYYESSQIYSKYSAAVYMENGMNNIYSGNTSELPAVPCYRGVGYSPSSEILRFPTLLKAANNYWGTASINDVNFTSYFDLYTWYRLSYEPYATKPFTEFLHTASIYGSLSIEAKLLDQAIKAELDGKIDLAIKKFERIIEKFPTSEENYIALSRLTDIYVKEEISLDPLVSIYDAQIASEDESVNKQYFKEMKIESKIKTKKYDEAIVLAEEMKSEAQTEGEILLAEINVSIANMLKDAESSGKGKSSSDPQSVIDLINKLTGNEVKTEPSYLAETLLPSESKLYQNYPNPFNPVTQIKFDLTKTAKVRLSVYNISGQVVAELTSGTMNAGHHAVDFDGSKLNSGIYYYTLETNSMATTKKMVLTK